MDIKNANKLDYMALSEYFEVFVERSRTDIGSGRVGFIVTRNPTR